MVKQSKQSKTRKSGRRVQQTVARLLAALDKAIEATEEARRARDALLRLTRRQGDEDNA